MAADIVSGLFGLSPGQIQQQQLAGDDAAAMQYAKLDPFQKANYSLGMGARGLTRTGAGMLGMQRPEEIEAQNRTAAMTDLNIQDPRAILERAAQTQDPRIRMQLQLLAQQRQKAIQDEQAAAVKLRLDEAKTARELALAERALQPESEKSPTSYREWQLAGSPGTYADWLKAKQDSGKTTIVNQMPGAEKVIDIPKFEREVQATIKAPLDMVAAATMASNAINDSIKTGNWASFNAGKQQLAKSFSDGVVSRAEVEAAGADPSMIGRILSGTSTFFTGTPTVEDQKAMLQTLKIIQDTASKRGQTALTRQRRVGELTGVPREALDTLLDFPEFKPVTPVAPKIPSTGVATLPSGKKITVTQVP